MYSMSSLPIHSVRSHYTSHGANSPKGTRHLLPSPQAENRSGDRRRSPVLVVIQEGSHRSQVVGSTSSSAFLRTVVVGGGCVITGTVAFAGMVHLLTSVGEVVEITRGSILPMLVLLKMSSPPSNRPSAYACDNTIERWHNYRHRST